MTFALASTRQRAPVQLIQTLEIRFGNKSTFSIERRPNAFVESCQNEVRPICTGCIIIGNQMDFAVGMAAGIRSHPLRGMDDFFQPREINAARNRLLQRPAQRLDVRLQFGDTILPLVSGKDLSSRFGQFFECSGFWQDGKTADPFSDRAVHFIGQQKFRDDGEIVNKRFGKRPMNCLFDSLA